MEKIVRIFKYLMITTILLSPLIYHLSQKYLYPEELDERKFFNDVYPEALFFSSKSDNPPHYKVFNKKNELQGIIFLTTDIFPGEKGYAGPIKILVGLDKQGNITGIKIISHSETPSYAGAITEQWFTSKYKNLNVNNSFEIGKDVDGITRATITVTSINRVVKKSIRSMGEKIFKLPVPKEEEFIYLDMLINKDIPLVIGLFILAVIAFKSHKKSLRNLTLILGIIYLGFFLENFLSIINILNILFWKLPNFTNHILWYIIILLILLTTFLWGRIYCYYICPFGGIQEFIYSLNRLGTVPPPDIEKKARYFKFIILWIIVMVASISGNFFLTSYEPFGTLFGKIGTILAWSLVLVTLISSFLYNRFWCKFFCSAGAVLDFLSKFSISKKK